MGHSLDFCGRGDNHDPVAAMTLTLDIYPLPRYQGRDPAISSGFGPRGTPPRMHSGADIAYHAIEGDPPYQGRYTAERSRNYFGPGDVPVLAAHTGQVMISRDEPISRGVIEIRNAGSTDRTVYRHLSERSVTEGQTVIAGQRIGTMGASKDTPFRHLHFGVRDERGKLVDPRPYLATANVIDGPSPATEKKNAKSWRSWWWLLIPLALVVSRRR